MHSKIKYSKESIATVRLILRLAVPENAEAIFAYRSHPVTNRYQGWIPASVEEVHEALKANTPDRPDRWLQFAIVELAKNKVIGDVSMHYTTVTQMQAEIGCALDRQYHRQGYAEEAVRLPKRRALHRKFLAARGMDRYCNVRHAPDGLGKPTRLKNRSYSVPRPGPCE